LQQELLNPFFKGPSSASFWNFFAQGFLQQRLKLYNSTTKGHLCVSWGWLSFRIYPNDGKESLVGVTVVPSRLSTSRTL